MVRNGKIVVTDSGKRGVRTTGKTATFNTNGECPECCEQECEDCKAETTPNRVVVTITGVLPKSGCSGAYFSYNSVMYFGRWLEAPAGLSEVTLYQDSGNPCVYLGVVAASAGLIGLYPDWNCDNEDLVASGSVTHFVVRLWYAGGGDARLDVWLVFDPDILFDPYGAGPSSVPWCYITSVTIPVDDGETLCNEEWTQNMDVQNDIWTGDGATTVTGYGGSASAVPE